MNLDLWHRHYEVVIQLPAHMQSNQRPRYRPLSSKRHLERFLERTSWLFQFASCGTSIIHEGRRRGRGQRFWYRHLIYRVCFLTLYRGVAHYCDACLTDLSLPCRECTYRILLNKCLNSWVRFERDHQPPSSQGRPKFYFWTHRCPHISLYNLWAKPLHGKSSHIRWHYYWIKAHKL